MHASAALRLWIPGLRTTLSGLLSLALAACGGGGSGGSSTPASGGQSPPTVSLAANPTSVSSGGTTLLSWTTTNADTCTASGGWSGNQAINGNVQSSAISASTTFTLNCSGPGGGAVARVTVNVNAANAPSVTFTASPTSVQSGAASQLTWTTTNVTSCTASGSWTGTKATSGTQSTGALTANASYTLTCSGAGGSAAQTATVTVGSAPSLTLTASPRGVAPNATTTLNWTSTNVTSCAASGGWSGSKALNGSEITPPLTSDQTYQLSCTGSNGNALAMTTVTIRTAVLSWTAPTQNVDGSPLTNLAGYKVYWGTTPGTYSSNASVSGAGTTTYTTNLTPGTWYFAVSALDATGAESAKTNEVSKTVF